MNMEAASDAIARGHRRMLIDDVADLLAPADTGGTRRISREVWRIVAPNPSPLTGPGTNTYVVGEQRRLVIDPGPADSTHIARILELTGGAIDRIVCTHSHTDHSPGAALLGERTGASVLGMPAPDVDDYQDGTYAPDHRLVDGERVEGADFALTVLHTPGHASNHVCLLLEAGGLLFTGDHLMGGSTVVILPPDGSMRQYLESLRRLRDLPVRDLAPGHGAVIQGAVAEIDRVIAHRLEREAKVIDAMRAQAAATLDTLLPVVYADVPLFMHPVARYSLLAHVIKLEEEGRVRRDGDAWTLLR
jgi:glyoxylase-like metal-dependent hydrolase (beta-lactamase superfamily II)